MKRLIILASITLGITLAQPTPANATSSTYAALGDSVAAGSGLPSSDPTCQRSSQAYPATVAQKTGLSLQHYACTGAKADEGIYDRQRRHGATIPAQLDQAFASGTPSLITLTIGANDVRWSQFIRQCYYTTCGTKFDTARFAAYLADLKLEMNVIMAKIAHRSNGTPPRVIVTGYYDPFTSRTRACHETRDLTSKEMSWLQGNIGKLNSALQGVVRKYSYANYASVSFTGHGLCSKDSWVQGQSDPMPFHPTAEGQEAIAKAVVAKYNSGKKQSNTPRSYREKVFSWLCRERQ